MKKLLFLIAVLAIVGCTKEEIKGCTDADSLSYNAEATLDDASCEYLADLYVGLYLVNDTSTYVSPNNGDTITITDNYTFTIKKTDYNGFC